MEGMVGACKCLASVACRRPVGRFGEYVLVTYLESTFMLVVSCSGLVEAFMLAHCVVSLVLDF